MVFERLDLAAHRGLRDVQFARGAREAHMARRRLEAAYEIE
jgi:hypothetical protein